jgi:hypothetical protein
MTKEGGAVAIALVNAPFVKVDLRPWLLFPEKMATQNFVRTASRPGAQICPPTWAALQLTL